MKLAKIRPGFTARIALGISLAVLAFLSPARASLLTLTNLTDQHQPDTNFVRVTTANPNNPTLSDGTVITIGLPVRVTPASNGLFSVFRLTGNYLITGPNYGKGLLYRFPDDSSNATAIPLSGFNTFVTLLLPTNQFDLFGAAADAVTAVTNRQTVIRLANPNGASSVIMASTTLGFALSAQNTNGNQGTFRVNEDGTVSASSFVGLATIQATNITAKSVLADNLISGAVVTNNITALGNGVAAAMTNPANAFTGNGSNLTHVAGTVNVRDFGAKGDGSTPDDAAFAAAFASFDTGNGGTVYAPAGAYRLTNTLDIGGSPTTQRSNRGLRGDGMSTYLRVENAINGVRLLNSVAFKISDLTITEVGTVSNMLLISAVEGVGISEVGLVENVVITGGNDAFAVGTDPTSGDVAHVTFLKCTQSGARHAGYAFGNGAVGNVLSHNLYGCISQFSPYGVFQNGGGFNWYGGDVLHNSKSDFYVANIGGQGTTLTGVRSEISERFIDAAPGGGSGLASYIVQGCSVTGFLATNHVVIQWDEAYPLTIANSVFIQNVNSSGQTKIRGYPPYDPTISAPGIFSLLLENVTTDNTNYSDFIPIPSVRNHTTSINDNLIAYDGTLIAGSGVNLFSGIVAAARFIGDGSSLTNLPASANTNALTAGQTATLAAAVTNNDTRATSLANGANAFTGAFTGNAVGLTNYQGTVPDTNITGTVYVNPTNGFVSVGPYRAGYRFLVSGLQNQNDIVLWDTTTADGLRFGMNDTFGYLYVIGATRILSLQSGGGNVTVGTTTTDNGSLLQVYGTGYFSGTVTANAFVGNVNGTTNYAATNLNNSGSSVGQILTATATGVAFSNAAAGSVPNGLVTNNMAANVVVTNAGVATTITSNSVTSGTFTGNGAGLTNLTYIVDIFSHASQNSSRAVGTLAGTKTYWDLTSTYTDNSDPTNTCSIIGPCTLTNFSLEYFDSSPKIAATTNVTFNLYSEAGFTGYSVVLTNGIARGQIITATGSFTVTNRAKFWLFPTNNSAGAIGIYAGIYCQAIVTH
jgi:hypothetical protein